MHDGQIRVLPDRIGRDEADTGYRAGLDQRASIFEPLTDQIDKAGQSIIVKRPDRFSLIRSELSLEQPGIEIGWVADDNIASRPTGRLSALAEDSVLRGTPAETRTAHPRS